MKIQKLLFLFLLILFPMMVHADNCAIQVKSIALKESSDTALELEEASIKSILKCSNVKNR